MKKITLKKATANFGLFLMTCLFLSFNSYSQSVTMSFLPGGVDNCGNPLPNAGVYTLSGTSGGKNAYYNGTNLRIIWTGTQWELQAKDPCCGGGFLAQWYNTANTPTMPPATCWQASFGCFPIQLSGPDAVNITPAVSVQPSNSTICSGNNTSFGITTTGNLLTYQWQVSTDGGSTFNNLSNGGVYSNVTTATMNITGATAGLSTYQYQCVVSGPCATATSNAATLTVNGTPAVSVQPSNSAICAGANTSFAVTATGAGLTYQWQVSTNGGTTFSNLSNGGVYSNVTTAIMNITGATAGMNAYQYKCVISGTCAPAATSNAVTLTINALPAVSVQPSNSTICAGNNTSFAVTATGAGLTYQWQVSTNGGTTFSNLSNGGVYSNVTSATMNITGATAGMNTYQYKCVISGTCAPAATSNAVTLTVNPLPTVNPAPGAQTVCSGSAVSAEAFTSTPAGGTFAWTNSNVSIGIAAGGSGNIAGYTAPVVAAQQVGTISVTPTLNGCVGTPGTFNITIRPKPTYTLSGNAYTICNGGSQGLSVSGASTYTWTPAATLAGANTANPTANPTTTTVYSVTGTSALGCSNLTPATVTVNVTAIPSMSLTANSYTICNGSSQGLSVSGASTYTWSPAATLTGANTANPTANPTTTTIYTVNGTASGCGPSAPLTLTLTVNSTPSIINTFPASSCGTGSITLNALADLGTINWYDAPTAGTLLGTGTSFTTPGISNSTTYYVDATSNGCTTPSRTGVLATVNPLPQISISGTPTICHGTSTSLTASGADTYTWSSGVNAIAPPLDAIPTSKLAVGLHKLQSSYTGNALRLRRTSDNAEQDFGFVGNDLDAASIATFLNGFDGYCTTLYDQSGNGNDVVQTNQPNQPLYVATSAMNSKPALNFSSSQFMTNSFNYVTPYSVVYGAQQTGPSRQRMLSSINNNWLLGWWGGLQTQAYFEGWVNNPSTTASSNYLVYSGTSDGTNSSLYENGTSITTNSNGVAGPNGISLNQSGIYGEQSDGNWTDVIIFSSVLSNTDRSTVENSILGYYGTMATVSPTSNTTYSVTGIYAATGCTNTTTVSVNISTSASTQTLTKCAGQSVTVGANTYTASGTYNDVLTSVLTGCDSTVTTNLTVLPANTYTQTLTKCAGQSVTVGANTYTASGTYNDVLTAVSSGCDSTVTTNLTVLPANTYTQTLTRCAGGSVTVGANTYTASGTYNDVLTDVSTGCDSTVTTNLNVLPANTFTQSPSICAGASITVGTHTYTTAGTYTDVLTAVSTGCDSTITTNLTVNSLPSLTFVINNGVVLCDWGSSSTPDYTLTATPGGGAFLGTAVSGNVFSPYLAGVGTFTLTYNYTNTVTTCSNSTTATTTVSICEGIANYNQANNLQVYPNPFSNELTIVSTAKTNAMLFDMLGNKINEFVLQNTTQTILLDGLAPGMYYLQVDNSKIKIIKQ